MSVKIYTSWEYIITNAKEQGRLRQEGKEEEAIELENSLKEIIYNGYGICIGKTGDL